MHQEISTFSPPARKTGKGEKFNQNIPGSAAKLAVVGAGIMGVCSAYYLARKGFRVTLFDKRGPGNSASSSGGESRLLRLFYGASEFYSRLTLDALPLWMELQKRSVPFFIPSPVLWLAGKKNLRLITDSFSFLDAHEIKYKQFSRDYLRKTWPFMRIADIELAVMEQVSGYLKARKACQAIASNFVEEGGQIKTEEVKLSISSSQELALKKSSGDKEHFDYLVIAAGPWLNEWVKTPLIEVTRQEVHYFDIPKISEMQSFPSWVDLSYEPYFYGIPGDFSRGFKIACDFRGARFDPDLDDRIPDQDSIKQSRNFLKFRFPALSNSSLIECRVCQYSNTIDRNLIIDTHPEYENILLVGGGSGHGFKYGPAIGQLISEFVAGEKSLPDETRYF